MKVQVIDGGDTAFKALVYPPPDQTLLTYLQDNIHQAAHVLGDIGSNFVNNAQNMYDRFNSSEAINAGKAILYGAGTHLNQNVIYPVALDQFPNANLIMQHYIMEEPSVNRMYQKGTCNGFADTYFDNEVGVFGKERSSYMRVMDGVMDYSGKDNDGYITHYSFEDGRDDLDTFDKFSVLDTWDNVRVLIAQGIDPTDLDQGEL